MTRTLVIASFAVAALALATLVALDLDVGASDQLRDDLILRASTPTSPYRHGDPSPTTVWLPSDLFIRDEILSGELPEWNRRAGGGFSVLAQLQPGALFPLRYLLAPVPARQYQAALWLFTLAALFAGTALVARRAGASTSSSLVSALAATLSCNTLSFVVYDVTLVLAFLPWTALALRRAFDDKPRGAVFIALTTGLMLCAGHPLLFATALEGALLLALLIGPRPSRRALVTAVGSLVAGAGLATPAWLPFVRALPSMWSYKTATAAGVAYRALPWSEWASLMTRAFAWPGAPYPLSESLKNSAVLGPATTLLAVVGAIVAWRAGQRALAFLLPVLAFIALPPPPLSFLGSVPLLRLEHPWYLLPPLVAVAALAAARGLDAVTTLAFARGTDVAARGLDVPTGSEGPPRVDAPAAVRAGRARAGHVVVAGIAAMAVAAPGVSRVPLAMPIHARTGDEGHGFAPSSPALALLESDRDARIIASPGDVLPPNTAALFGLDDARMQGPLIPDREHRLWLAVDPAMPRYTYPTAHMTRLADHPLVAKRGVRFVLASKLRGTPWLSALDDADPVGLNAPTLMNTADFPLAYEDAGLAVYRVPNPSPRARVAPHPVVVAGVDEAAAALAADPGADVVEAAVAIPAPGDTAASEARAVTRYDGEKHVRVDVDTPAAGLVVVADAYADGWSATVDGASAAILPVNINARGVLVPAGAHVVEMRYRTPGLVAGALAALLTAALLALATRRGR